MGRGVSAVVLMVLWCGGVNGLFNSLDQDVYCYQVISNGTETCYYRPPTGYECEHGTQDENLRNLTSCDLMGICYHPMAGNKEVCYYTPPFGYFCYFERIDALIANMTNCKFLKANSAPTITFGTVGPIIVDEDEIAAVEDITITDLDARDGEVEGKGFLRIQITSSNGWVAFDTSILRLTDTVAADAADEVLGIINPPIDSNELRWVSGNGSLATYLEFEARSDPLNKLMKALVWKGFTDFNENTLKTGALSVFVDDQGNTGGTAETSDGSLSFRVIPVNDPPSIYVPPQPTTLEDTPLTLQGIVASDVDAGEGADPTVKITLQVGKGSLDTVGGTGITPNVVTPSELELVGTLADLNAMLAGDDPLNHVLYTPQLDSNDDTPPGHDNLTVTVNDKANTGKVLSVQLTDTAEVELSVTPVNDAPVAHYPSTFMTDEDVPIIGLNITVTDVDTSTNIMITLGVLNGVLSIPDIYGGLTNATVWYVGTLEEINDMLANTNYTSNPDYNSEANSAEVLTINVNDQLPGGQAPTTAITVFVEAVNDPPFWSFSCTSPDPCTIDDLTLSAPNPDDTIDFTGASTSEPLIQANDVDADPALIGFAIAAASGNFTFPTVAGVSLNSLFGHIAYGLGTIADINAMLTGFRYTRVSMQPEVISFSVDDEGKQGKGNRGFDTVYLRIP